MKEQHRRPYQRRDSRRIMSSWNWSALAYLNAYVPKLTTEGCNRCFLPLLPGTSFHLQPSRPQPLTDVFIKSLTTIIEKEGLELVRFKKGQHEDDVLQKRCASSRKTKALLSSALAQEKVRVPRTTRIRLDSGGSVRWNIFSTALIERPSPEVFTHGCRQVWPRKIPSK